MKELEEFLAKEQITTDDVEDIVSSIDTGTIKSYCAANLISRGEFDKKYKELLEQIGDITIYEFENTEDPSKKDKLVLSVLALKVLYNKKTRKLKRNKDDET